jgi:hypothetical protein
MVNTFNTIKDGPGLFAQGIAQTLKDNLVFCGMVDKADQSDFDGKNGFKSGDTIYTSIPPRYISTSDALDVSSNIKDTVEEKAALSLNKTETIAMKVDSLELATKTDVATALKNHGMPAAESIAHAIESRCLQIASDATYNSVGTAGSNTFTTADILAARTKLNQNLCPIANRKLLMNSASGALAVDARKAYNNPASEVGSQYKDGRILTADGFGWYENELLNVHANGSDVTGIAINDAAVAEGAGTITVDGASAAPTAGSVFTIAGVFDVHPITKVVSARLKQFVVVSATTTVITISPSLYAASGGLKNVSALPADDAALVFVGAATTGFTQNLAFHPSAFKMVTAPLYAPKGVDLVATETIDGITVNIVRDFDIKTREVITRLDVLFGFDKIRPEWACRITA